MKKTFALALCLIVMLSALPTTALADNGFAIEGPADGYTYESGVLKFTKSGTYKISMAGGVTSTTDHIEISGNSLVSSNTSGAAQDITLVLSDLTMVSDIATPNIKFVNSSSDINVCFDIRGTNSLTNTKSASSNWDGYCIGAPSFVNYTVIGSGSLTLTSKRSSKWSGKAFTLNSKDVALTLNNCSIDMWTRMNINAGTLEINSTEDCIMFSINATGFTMTGGHVILNSSNNAGIWYNIKNNVPNFTMEGGTLTIRFGGSYGIIWTSSKGQRINISGGEIEIGERASASVLIGNATNHSFASEYAHKNYILSTDNKLTEIPDTSVFNATGGLHSYYRYLLITPTDKIEYDLNGGEYKKADGTAGENPNPVTYSRVDSFTLINPTRDGYNFTGWTGSNGSTPETSVTVNGSNGLGKKTYTANWELIEYEVTINSGEHMTKTTDSGTASQSVTYGSAMTNVVYTANDGYYFPEDYAVAPVNGISVTRIGYSQIKVSGSPTADASITLTAPTAKTKEATPGAEFNATGADCGTLTKVSSGMKYSIDGGTTWSDITGTTVTIPSGVNTTNGIQVYQPGNGTTTIDSDKQTITVTKAVTPNLAAAQPATIGGKGSIPTTTDHQQSTDGTTWTDCTGAWSDLAAGTYYIRVKPSGATLASDAQTITISEYIPGKEATPSAVFNAAGTDTGTLSGLIDGGEYTLSGASPASFTASGTAQELTGVSPGTLLLVKKGNGSTTNDSDPQSITVTKAAAPTAPTAVNCTTADNNDGKLVGITAAMEYKKSDADAWTAGTGNDMTGLVPGTYFVRVKAAGATLASDNQEISIAEYTAPEQVARPTFTPASGTAFTGSGSVEISSTTEGAAIYYTTDGTEPTANSTKYTGPIAVSENTTIKAIAIKDGMTDSSVAEAVYTMTVLKAYTVTVTNDGNGTGSASPNSGYEGTEVLLTAAPATGYKFKEWQVVSGGVTIKDNKFNIGKANVEVKAVFEAQATGWHKGEAKIKPGAPEIQCSNMQEVAESIIAAIQKGEMKGISEEVRKAVLRPDARVLVLFISAPLSPDQIPAEDWAALQKLQEEAGYTGIVPFDITLMLNVNGQDVAEVHETKIPVKFSVGIMGNLLDKTRTFALANVHNNVAKIIPTTRRGNFLDGQSTEFSTYAIAYKDEEIRPIDPTKFDDVAVPSDSFTFKKVWQGDSEKSIDFTLYKQGGTVYHHGFDKKIVSNREWRYNAWFSSPAACYVIEQPIPGYQTKYVNVGVYAGITDRCCDGGTIINKKIPKTGDSAPLALWAGMVALGVIGLTAVLVIGKKRKANQ